jgi:hydroxymethylbilane synthase
MTKMNHSAPLVPRTYKVVCRGSWLSLAQVSIFEQLVQKVIPGATVEAVIRQTEGDKNQSTPLHLVEGKDFFTKAIQDSLLNGEADFALHSMKDVASEDFFAHSQYGIVCRDAMQDVAVFNNNIIDKLKKGASLCIGTSSPRRSTMATNFLQKALPQFGTTIQLIAEPVRGNVDSRLRQLNEGNYDGLILAAAGLQRLLQYEPAAATVKKLLADKKLMVLPLFECTPAAGQGAIVAETGKQNTEAIALLQAIANPTLTHAIEQERAAAHRRGFGCSQQFGTFSLQTAHTNFSYTHGLDATGKPFTEWDFESPVMAAHTRICSTTDYMKDLFNHQYLEAIVPTDATVFVASHKAVHSRTLATQLQQQPVWVAGTKTWLALAQKGIWVSGSADGLGLQWILPLLQGLLFGYQRAPHIITHTAAAIRWQQDGLAATSTYELLPTLHGAFIAALQNAGFIFWTSMEQYIQYREYCPAQMIHGCPAGKTATLLLQAGVQPIIFPTIKAFIQWKQSSFPLPAEG